MNNTKQNLIIAIALALLCVNAYGIFAPKAVDQSLKGFAQQWPITYRAAMTNTTTTVGTAASVVLNSGVAALNEFVENLGTSTLFCYAQATSTGVVVNAGFAITQYGYMQTSQIFPYTGGVACVASASTTVSIS